MKCKYCESTWDTTIQVKKCPFCGKNLYENTDYTISSALAKVVEDCGLEILCNSGKLTAYIMDYVKGDERNKKLFRIAGNTGVLNLLYEAKVSKDKIHQESLITKSLKLLEEEAFLSTENAMNIVKILVKGLELDFKGKETDKNIKETLLFPGHSKVIDNIFKVVGKVVEDNAEVKKNLTREQYLLMLVDRKKRVTKEENQEIFVYGKRKLREGNFRLGIELIRFASNHGLKDADFLLGYCYEEGIGIKKNANAAEAFYRVATVSNPEFEEYYYHGNLSSEGVKKAAEFGKRLYEYALIKK